MRNLINESKELSNYSFRYTDNGERVADHQHVYVKTIKKTWRIYRNPMYTRGVHSIFVTTRSDFDIAVNQEGTERIYVYDNVEAFEKAIKRIQNLIK